MVFLVSYNRSPGNVQPAILDETTSEILERCALLHCLWPQAVWLSVDGIVTFGQHSKLRGKTRSQGGSYTRLRSRPTRATV